MTETVRQKRTLIPKRLNGALQEILKEVGRPVEILELERMAEARGFNPARAGKNFYILAKGEEAAFVVDEYPSYKLRSQTKLPVFDDVNRGVQYPAVHESSCKSLKRHLPRSTLVGGDGEAAYFGL